AVDVPSELANVLAGAGIVQAKHRLPQFEDADSEDRRGLALARQRSVGRGGIAPGQGGGPHPRAVLRRLEHVFLDTLLVVAWRRCLDRPAFQVGGVELPAGDLLGERSAREVEEKVPLARRARRLADAVGSRLA